MKRSWAIAFEIVLFFIAAIFFFLFFCIAFDMFSCLLVKGYRSIPAFVSYFMPTYFLFLFHRLSRERNIESLTKHAKTNGAIIISLSFYLIVMDIAYFSLGAFSDLVDGSIAPLYPLDTLLIGLLSAGIGAQLYLNKCAWLFVPLIGEKNECEFTDLLSSIVKSIGTLLSLYMVGALLWGFDFADWTNPYFPCLVPLFLSMIGLALLLAYDIYLESCHPMFVKKNTKTVILISLSIFGFIAIVSSIIVFCLVPNIVIIVGQAYFRFDAVCSVNLSPFALTIPLGLYIFYLWGRFLIKNRQTAAR